MARPLSDRETHAWPHRSNVHRLIGASWHSCRPLTAGGHAHLHAALSSSAAPCARRVRSGETALGRLLSGEFQVLLAVLLGAMLLAVLVITVLT